MPGPELAKKLIALNSLFLPLNNFLVQLYGQILSNPKSFRQLSCRDSMITLYNCPLENKYEDVWSHHNYIIYVMEEERYGTLHMVLMIYEKAVACL
jgi:hypothetical protein